MINVSHIITPDGYEMGFVIEAMRNPKESYDKIDSVIVDNPNGRLILELGPNDKSLMTRLCKAGTEHRKFMRQMIIHIRIKAPIYWWKEFDTYKIGTVANSTSTMHKLHSRPIDISDFSTDHMSEASKSVMKTQIAAIEFERERYFGEETTDDKKDAWYQMIQLLPSSYNQTRNVTMNYEVAHTIYHQRKNHKLDEWREFCKVLEKLPFNFLITGQEGEG